MSRGTRAIYGQNSLIGITTSTTINSRQQRERTHQHERRGVKGASVISYLPVNIPTRIWWSWLVKIIPSDAMFSSALARTDKPEQSRETSASNSGGGVRWEQPNPEHNTVDLAKLLVLVYNNIGYSLLSSRFFSECKRNDWVLMPYTPPWIWDMKTGA